MFESLPPPSMKVKHFVVSQVVHINIEGKRKKKLQKQVPCIILTLQLHASCIDCIVLWLVMSVIALHYPYNENQNSVNEAEYINRIDCILCKRYSWMKSSHFRRKTKACGSGLTEDNLDSRERVYSHKEFSLHAWQLKSVKSASTRGVNGLWSQYFDDWYWVLSERVCSTQVQIDLEQVFVFLFAIKVNRETKPWSNKRKGPYCSKWNDKQMI